MQVLKFGGTSVANAENIMKVIEILDSKSKDDAIVVVVSALGGVTDSLHQVGELAHTKDDRYLKLFKSISERHLDTAKALKISSSARSRVKKLLKELKRILQGIYLINEFSEKTQDKVLSFGELISSFIISEALRDKSSNAGFKDSRELIITDDNFTHAQVHKDITFSNIQTYFSSSADRITVMPGFISQSESGESTTLGRGGSDYTASILAAALDANVLEIWTDVSGMYTANPKLVRQAFPIKEITYKEAMELSHFGAKVLYPPTIRPVLEKGIPIAVKNTFSPEDEGTLIQSETPKTPNPVKGISHLPKIALLTLEGTALIGVPGSSKRLFETLSTEQISVILITQASSEHSICIAIKEEEADLACKVINEAFAYEITLGKINPVNIENDLAIVAVIGDQMKSHQGISGKMFSSLGKNNVNILAIAQGASERNISAVIASKDVKKALNTLHYRFFERQVKELNIFVVGVGNVGRRLLDQLKQQQAHLYENLFLNAKVVGLSNSRQMTFDAGGIDLSEWEELLETGEKRTEETWFNTIKDLNLRNSVFIDITANADIAASYSNYLKESIAVIACNKIACSSEFSSYKELKNLARKYNAPFLFETNVGAGLPVINTLNNLINSGDRITSIKAVLSGSLNFIFNHFNETTSFHDVVKQAQAEGYTEPDPRIDLSGVDVARKILILARESGFEMDIEDIENEMFLPAASMEAPDVDAFYETLIEYEDHFASLFKEASDNDCRLKYVAEFNEGKAKVGLQQIGKEDPFYNLDGKDNIVLYYTSRYVDQPLIIKGAGAGAEVTASGLFGDIISLGKK